MKKSIEERFWEKVGIKSDNECWEWLSGKYPNGYGQFKERSYKVVPAHRISYKIIYGNIPEEICVCHKCDNHGCVNPNHLFLGTHADNMKDSSNKGRINGENHKQHKLSLDEVKEIRKIYQSGKFSQQYIADMHGISQSVVSLIIRNVDWREK